MPTVLNYPDFLIDPAFDTLSGTNIVYNGASAIGGGINKLSTDEYMQSFEDALIHSGRFTARFTLRLIELKSTGFFIGGRGSGGAEIYIRFTGTGDDILNQIVVTIDNGTTSASTVHSVDSIAITNPAGTILRCVWTYEKPGPTPTTRLEVYDAAGSTLLIDISSNAEETFSIT